MLKCPPSHVKKGDVWASFVALDALNTWPPLSLRWDFQALFTSFRLLEFPPPDDPPSIQPTPRVREYKDVAAVYKLSSSSRIRPVHSYKSSYDVFLLKRPFHAGDKNDEGSARKVNLGRWYEKRVMFAPHCSGRNQSGLGSGLFSASATAWIYFNIQKAWREETWIFNKKTLRLLERVVQWLDRSVRPVSQPRSCDEESRNEIEVIKKKKIKISFPRLNCGSGYKIRGARGTPHLAHEEGDSGIRLQEFQAWW